MQVTESKREKSGLTLSDQNGDAKYYRQITNYPTLANQQREMTLLSSDSGFRHYPRVYNSVA